MKMNLSTKMIISLMLTLAFFKPMHGQLTKNSVLDNGNKMELKAASQIFIAVNEVFEYYFNDGNLDQSGYPRVNLLNGALVEDIVFPAVIPADGWRIIYPKNQILNNRPGTFIYPIKEISGQLKDCPNVKTVRFESRLETTPSLFSKCITVESVTLLPNSIKEISVNTFDSCVRLSKIEVPYSLEKIDAYAFRNCLSLKTMIVLDKDGKPIFAGGAGGYPSENRIIIPDNVTHIDYQAFENCKNMTRVDFDPLLSQLKIIGNSAFRGCDSLTDINIPQSVESIELGAFANTGLFGVTLPSTLNRLNGATFYGCKNLSFVNLPNSIEEIGNSEFGECKNLRAVELSAKLQIIPSKAFSKSGLAKIELPNNVLLIEEQAFAECKNLKEVKWSTSLANIDSKAFYECDSLIKLNLPNSLIRIAREAFCGCSNLDSIIFPKNLETIGSQAFSECESLMKVVIPEKLKEIGLGAFWNCQNLHAVHMRSSIPPTTYDNQSFGYDVSDVTLYVPKGSKLKYQGWQGFTNIKEEGEAPNTDKNKDASLTSLHYELDHVMVNIELFDDQDTYTITLPSEIKEQCVLTLKAIASNDNADIEISNPVWDSAKTAKGQIVVKSPDKSIIRIYTILFKLSEILPPEESIITINSGKTLTNVKVDKIMIDAPTKIVAPTFDGVEAKSISVSENTDVRIILRNSNNFGRFTNDGLLQLITSNIQKVKLSFISFMNNGVFRDVTGQINKVEGKASLEVFPIKTTIKNNSAILLAQALPGDNKNIECKWWKMDDESGTIWTLITTNTPKTDLRSSLISDEITITEPGYYLCEIVNTYKNVSTSLVSHIKVDISEDATSNYEISNTIEVKKGFESINIYVPMSTTAYIFTFGGQLKQAMTIPAGESRITLSQGAYIVRINDKVFKIVI